MQLKFLGTGGAFDYEYGNASLTVDLSSRILVDCGPTVFPALMRKNLIGTIDYLLLTHLHGDHVGSLFQVIYFTGIFLKRKLKILYATQIFRDQITQLLDIMAVPREFYEMITLESMPSVSFIETTGKHAENVTSFAYIFKDKRETVFFSGDLGDIEVIKAFLELPQDEILRIFHDMSPIKSKSHAHYLDLQEIARQNLIFAYHLNPTCIPDDNKVPLVINFTELLW